MKNFMGILIGAFMAILCGLTLDFVVQGLSPQADITWFFGGFIIFAVLKITSKLKKINHKPLGI